LTPSGGGSVLSLYAPSLAMFFSLPGWSIFLACLQGAGRGVSMACCVSNECTTVYVHTCELVPPPGKRQHYRANGSTIPDVVVLQVKCASTTLWSHIVYSDTGFWKILIVATAEFTASAVPDQSCACSSTLT
jgi:hypothetical protein